MTVFQRTLINDQIKEKSNIYFYDEIKNNNQ